MNIFIWSNALKCNPYGQCLTATQPKKVRRSVVTGSYRIAQSTYGCGFNKHPLGVNKDPLEDECFPYVLKLDVCRQCFNAEDIDQWLTDCSISN